MEEFGDVKEFDVIIVGTGITESIVARSALTRVGYSVLHIDSEEYYGGTWNSFPLSAMEELADSQSSHHLSLVQNFSSKIHDPNIIAESRKFSLDLSPSVMFSVGHMCDLLVKSNVGQYMEFVAPKGVSILIEGSDSFTRVPSSRQDVFSAKNISMVEKRLLMKFIENISEMSEEEIDNSDITFAKFVEEKKLTPKLREVILFAIGMLSSGEIDSLSLRDGIPRVKQHIDSIGVYSDSPLLYSFYGTSEFSQAFCRSSAVFGGVYVLRRSPDMILLGNNSVIGVKDSNGNTLSSRSVVMDPRFAGDRVRTSTSHSVYRWIGVTEESIWEVDESETEKSIDASFGVIPPSRLGNASVVYVYQLFSSIGVCSKGKYVVHVVGDSSEDVREVVNHFIHEKKRTLFYECSFSIPLLRKTKEEKEFPSGLFVFDQPFISSPHVLDSIVNLGKDMFQNVCLYLGKEDAVFFPNIRNAEEDDDRVNDEEAAILEIDRVDIPEEEAEDVEIEKE